MMKHLIYLTIAFVLLIGINAGQAKKDLEFHVLLDQESVENDTVQNATTLQTSQARIFLAQTTQGNSNPAGLPERCKVLVNLPRRFDTCRIEVIRKNCTEDCSEEQEISSDPKRSSKTYIILTRNCRYAITLKDANGKIIKRIHDFTADTGNEISFGQ